MKNVEASHSQENTSSSRTSFPCVLFPSQRGGAFIHTVLSFLDYCIKLASIWMETLYLISREHITGITFQHQEDLSW